MRKSISTLIASTAIYTLLCATSTAAIAAQGDDWITCKDGVKMHSGANCSEHGGVVIAARKSTPIDTTKGLTPSKTAKATKSKKRTTASNTAQKKSTAAKSSSPTAKCNDGAMYFSTQRKGACAKHGGVKAWY